MPNKRKDTESHSEAHARIYGPHKRPHKHRPTIVEREVCWTHCVTPAECAARPARQVAHGNIIRIDVCRCGAERSAEINGGRTNYGPWREGAEDAEANAFPERQRPPDPDGMNDARAEWAAAALSHFQCCTGTDYEDAMADLLGDLMHLADRSPYDFEAALAKARGMYAEETARP